MTRRKKELVSLISLLFLLSAFAMVCHAQVPQQMNYQGYLTGAGGDPITGIEQMEFAIYRVPAGGSPLWSEPQDVMVEGGIYNVILGTFNPINLAFDEPYYLGVTVGTDDEMTHRQPLTSVGYAFRAEDAETLDNRDSTYFSPADHEHDFSDIAGEIGDAQVPNNITIDHAEDADTVDGQHANEFAASTHSHDHGSLSGLSADDHTQYFNLSQNETVSGRPAFNGGISGSSSPFTVDSSYLVASLNADLLDGQHASAFASSSHNHNSLYYTESESDSRFVNTTGDIISGTSSGPLLTVTNNGTGDGIEVSSAGSYGVHVANAGNDGVHVGSAAHHGLAIGSAGSDGVRVGSTNLAGIHVDDAGSDGVAVYYPGDDGFHVEGAGGDGVYVSSAGAHGVSVDSAGWHGVYVGSAAYHGVYVGSNGDDHDGIHVYSASDDGIQIENAGYGLYAPYMTNYGVYVGGGRTGGHFEDTDSGIYAEIATGNFGIYTNGSIYAEGPKSFVQEHPIRSDQVIIYAALEGGEAGTYYRGSAQLANGTATIELPEHFSLVTEEEGLTVQVTPRADCKGLYVAELTTTSIVVRELQGGTSSARFDFFINGIRTGYADYKVINSRSELGLDEIEETRQEKERQEAERRAEREREREETEKQRQERERERKAIA